MNIVRASTKPVPRLLQNLSRNPQIIIPNCKILWATTSCRIQPFHQSVVFRTNSSRPKLDQVIASPFFRTLVCTGLLTTVVIIFPFLFTFTILGAIAWTIYRLIIRPSPGSRASFVDVLFPSMLGTKGFSKRARELRHHAIDMLSHDLRLRSVTFSDVKTLNTEIFEVGNLRKEVIVVEFLIIRDGKAIGEVRAVEDGGKNIRLDVRLLDGTRFSTDHRREGKVIDAEHWTVRKG